MRTVCNTVAWFGDVCVTWFRAWGHAIIVRVFFGA